MQLEYVLYRLMYSLRVIQREYILLYFAAYLPIFSVDGEADKTRTAPKRLR
jgi:hypothetical protein